ncbi:tripartite motif-containing protein 77-like [Prionailurus iriomotensis]
MDQLIFGGNEHVNKTEVLLNRRKRGGKRSFNKEITNQDIKLFDNVRCLRCRHDHQNASLNSERSNYCAVWRTSRHIMDDDFTSGKQYWELDVGQVLGVSSRSL